MIQSQILFLMTGLLFGTTLLAAGMALGFWMARRGVSDMPVEGGKPTVDPREFLTMVRTIAESTNTIATDISKYQERMQELVDLSRNFTGKDAEALKPILDQIYSANAQLQRRLHAAEEKLEQQHSQLKNYVTEARTDALTGLPNRRAFDQGLDQLYSNHLKSRQEVSLVLLDVDHFKKFNDTYGHTVGDVVLKRVGDHLAAFASDCHLVARYGGEEFGILVAGSMDQAAKLAESIRIAIAADQVEAEGHTVRITISAGASQLIHGERIGDLVRRSDQALYRAKQEGRNRVVSFAPNPKKPAADTVSQPVASPAVPVSNASVPTCHIPSNTDSYPNDRNDRSLGGIEEIEKRMLDHLNQIVHEESKR